jgi:protein TonB
VVPYLNPPAPPPPPPPFDAPPPPDAPPATIKYSTAKFPGLYPEPDDKLALEEVNVWVLYPPPVEIEPPVSPALIAARISGL